MQYLGFLMKPLSDSMSAEFPHHAVSISLGVMLNGSADISKAGAGMNFANAKPKTFIGLFAKSPGLNGGGADMEHAAGIAMKSILNDSNVNIQDVSRTQDTVTWNTMAHLMIDRRAY